VVNRALLPKSGLLALLEDDGEVEAGIRLIAARVGVGDHLPRVAFNLQWTGALVVGEVKSGPFSLQLHFVAAVRP